MATSVAGPSRLPTISTEDEEIAAESGTMIASADEPTDTPAKAEGDAAEEPTISEEPVVVADPACQTLYIQNLNEKVQVEVMKHTLQNLFKTYRPVLPIVAHRNVRMRGQAFVSFQDVEMANRAKKEVNEFPLYGKAMQISFAKSKSESVIKRTDGQKAMEEHRKQRLEEKKRKRRDNPLRRKSQAALKAGGTETAEAAPVPAKKARVQMPDEYLPANNILFVQNLPEGTTSDDLREVFELHPGLVEIRTIPAKKDIAFIEYVDEAASAIAKDALHNFKIDGETKMKVTYARR